MLASVPRQAWFWIKSYTSIEHFITTSNIFPAEVSRQIFQRSMNVRIAEVVRL